MPFDFSDKETVFHRAVRVWCWRKPHKDESFDAYRIAFADYVRHSDPEEADAIERGELFTKYDGITSVPTVR
jgi:hypothetical protein